MTTCEAREAECKCVRETRHKIHRCDCGGAWTYNEAGEMVPRAFPGGETNLWRAMDRLLDPWGGMFR